MTTVAESSAAPLEFAAGLQTGTSTLSQQQIVQFVKYVRLVLPIDKMVFWVKAELLSQSALFNVARFNSAQFNGTGAAPIPAPTINAAGSLHFSTDVRQEEDRNAAFNQMIFTSETPINDLNSIGPDELYIAEQDGVKFAFSSRMKYYYQAGLHHYRGDALYSVMDTQLIDDPASFDAENVIVSNSLPIWLSLNAIMPMYPSFLTPQNQPPVYAAVHIDPDTTRALQSAPYLAPDSTHWQLAAETVKITIYGLRNFNALDFQDYVMGASLTQDNFGIMNCPIIHDEKLTQREFGVIAMKKSITFDINYYQTRARDIARQMILSAFCAFTPSPT